MKVERVTNDWLETDDDGVIWISPIKSNKYYLVGPTYNKTISLDIIDICFEENKLAKGKYHYYYTDKKGEEKKLLDTDKVFSKVHAKGLDNQKSFFKPKQGALMTYYPQYKSYKYKFSIIMAMFNAPMSINGTSFSKHSF